MPPKERFRKFTYQGVDLDKLVELSHEEFSDMVTARIRRKFRRGISKGPIKLLKKLRKARAEAAFGEKPATVKTHLRNMVIVPEMFGSVVGVHNGLSYVAVEIKPEMVGHYLGEFALTYKPVKHGKPGIGATHSSSVSFDCVSRYSHNIRIAN